MGALVILGSPFKGTLGFRVKGLGFKGLGFRVSCRVFLNKAYKGICKAIL